MKFAVEEAAVEAARQKLLEAVRRELPIGRRVIVPGSRASRVTGVVISLASSTGVLAVQLDDGSRRTPHYHLVELFDETAPVAASAEASA